MDQQVASHCVNTISNLLVLSDPKRDARQQLNDFLQYLNASVDAFSGIYLDYARKFTKYQADITDNPAARDNFLRTASADFCAGIIFQQ